MTRIKMLSDERNVGVKSNKGVKSVRVTDKSVTLTSVLLTSEILRDKIVRGT